MSARRQARRELGTAALITEAEAVALIPCRDSTARAWLRDNDLVIHHPVLGRVVVWGDVVAEVRAGRGPQEPEGAPAATATLRRAGLRRR